jgi:uncharacterized membrane protein YbhN (UPF0104 family)
MLLTWLFFGLHVIVLAYSFGASGWETVPVAISGYALAMVAGFVVAVVPAGLGVREAVLIATLGTTMSRSAATAVAIVSRLCMLVGDAAATGAAGIVRAARRDGERDTTRSEEQSVADSDRSR